jgi:hypothetical protein
MKYTNKVMLFEQFKEEECLDCEEAAKEIKQELEKAEDEAETEDEENLSLTVKFTNLNKSDLLELQKMFKAMEWSASMGASREMSIYVDGDGSFRAKIEMDKQPTDEEIKASLEEYDNDGLDIGLGC